MELLKYGTEKLRTLHDLIKKTSVWKMKSFQRNGLTGRED